MLRSQGSKSRVSEAPIRWVIGVVLVQFWAQAAAGQSTVVPPRLTLGHFAVWGGGQGSVTAPTDAWAGVLQFDVLAGGPSATLSRYFGLVRVRGNVALSGGSTETVPAVDVRVELLPLQCFEIQSAGGMRCNTASPMARGHDSQVTFGVMPLPIHVRRQTAMGLDSRTTVSLIGVSVSAEHESQPGFSLLGEGGIAYARAFANLAGAAIQVLRGRGGTGGFQFGEAGVEAGVGFYFRRTGGDGAPGWPGPTRYAFRLLLGGGARGEGSVTFADGSTQWVSEVYAQASARFASYFDVFTRVSRAWLVDTGVGDTQLTVGVGVSSF